MGFFRVGIVDFFGILCPGVLLFGNLLLFLFSIGELPTEIGQEAELLGSVLGSFALVVVCYFLGFVLRLISPDVVDWAASKFFFWLNKFFFWLKWKWFEKILKELSGDHSDNAIPARKNWGDLPDGFSWSEGRYPYYYCTRYVYSKYFSDEFARMFVGDPENHNKATYNFWKIWLTSHHPDVASLVYQAEASVRLMSGAFWALVVGVISGVFLTFQDWSVGLFVVVAYLIVIVILLKNFKNQRRREVKTLLDALLSRSVTVADFQNETDH